PRRHHRCRRLAARVHARPSRGLRRQRHATMSAARARLIRGPAAGFTLVEVMIAVAIVALLSLLGYRALAALSDSEEKLAAEATRWRTLDLFFARLEGDLRQAMPRPARSADTREPAWVGATDTAGNALVVFSRAGPEFALEPSSGGARLAYRFQDASVEVLYWASYDRPRGVQA